MQYESLIAYNIDGVFCGWIIRKVGTEKIWGSNLFETREEVESKVAQLNRDFEIKSNWPSVDDSRVQALLSNPEWESIEMVEADIEDVENSVYEFVPDEEGGFLDEENSKIVFMKGVIPARPIEVTERIRKAQEAVALLAMAE